MRPLLWRALALLSLALALVGVVLPVLPTVPFLLLAAWAASRGWPALDAWLLANKSFGPVIRDWRERGAVPRRAKWLASTMMLVSSGLLLASPAPLGVKVAVPTAMAAVALWLWRRPEA